MGFEPTIPVFEGAKTVNALDRALTAKFKNTWIYKSTPPYVFIV
jgi:hypothetical protein